MLPGPAFVVQGVEDCLAGEHLVEEAAEGIEVGAAVKLVGGQAAPLLGGGTGWGEQEAASAGDGCDGFMDGCDAEV